MEGVILIVKAEMITDEVNARMQELAEYLSSLEEVQEVSIGGGGFINTKPKP